MGLGSVEAASWGWGRRNVLEEEEVREGEEAAVNDEVVMVDLCELSKGGKTAEVVTEEDEVGKEEAEEGAELLEGVGGDWGGVVSPGTSWYT